MAKVITVSRTFPAYHPKAGQPTYFVEQILNALGIDYRSKEYFNLIESLNKDNEKLSVHDLIDFQERMIYGPEIESQKLHTIRAGHRWKAGDKASLRVWSGTPYNSPQIIIAPDVELVQIGGFLIHPDADDYDKYSWVDIAGKYWHKTDEDINKSIIPTVAKNDGLSTEDFLAWFKYPKPFEGQILCWKELGYA